MIEVHGDVSKLIYGSCKKKATFTNEKIARDKALSLGMRVYHCPICGFYHLSSHTKDGEEYNG